MSARAYGARMSGRAFVVTVYESPARVVVEEVRSRRRLVAADVATVAEQIARWLEAPPVRPAPPPSPEAPPRRAGR